MGRGRRRRASFCSVEKGLQRDDGDWQNKQKAKKEGDVSSLATLDVSGGERWTVHPAGVRCRSF